MDEQNLITLNSVLAEEAKSKAKEGGICATLAIAHSLVKIHGVIPQEADGDWPGVTTEKDGETVWDPEFLKKIYRATGDDDGNRGLSIDEIRSAHTADWSTEWRFHESKARDRILSPDSQPSEEELKEWCETLMRFVEERGDDCFLNVCGTQKIEKAGETEEKAVGHLMPITKVEYLEDSDECKLTTIDTGEQDSGGPWENVPFEPDNEAWTVTTEELKVTGWGSITWDEARCWCFDEDPKEAGHDLTERGDPGEALED